MVSLSMCGAEIYLEDTLYRKTACVVVADFDLQLLPLA
jgi:hypothetical protein